MNDAIGLRIEGGRIAYAVPRYLKIMGEKQTNLAWPRGHVFNHDFADKDIFMEINRIAAGQNKLKFGMIKIDLGNQRLVLILQVPLSFLPNP